MLTPTAATAGAHVLCAFLACGGSTRRVSRPDQEKRSLSNQRFGLRASFAYFPPFGDNLVDNFERKARSGKRLRRKGENKAGQDDLRRDHGCLLFQTRARLAGHAGRLDCRAACTVLQQAHRDVGANGDGAVYVLLPRQSTAVADGFALLTRPSSRSSLSYLSSLAQSRVRRSPPRFPLNSRQSRRGKLESLMGTYGHAAKLPPAWPLPV